MKPNPLNQREVIDALAALAEIIKANKNMLLGDEDVIEAANKKALELIPLINNPIPAK